VEVFAGGELVVKPEVLRSEADAALGGVGVAAQGSSTDEDLAGIGPQQSGDHGNGRGLPCPVRAQQADGLAFADPQRNAVHRDVAAVTLAERVGLEHSGNDTRFCGKKFLKKAEQNGPQRNMLNNHMAKTIQLLPLSAALLLFGCGTSTPPKEAAKEAAKAPEPEGPYRVYVTNEASGDLSVISSKNEVIATVKLGKRPRGIHASPDGKTIYVALSGSPMAPPGVDESHAASARSQRGWDRRIRRAVEHPAEGDFPRATTPRSSTSAGMASCSTRRTKTRRRRAFSTSRRAR
jgi:YVTN family beta-propeller protein